MLVEGRGGVLGVVGTLSCCVGGEGGWGMVVVRRSGIRHDRLRSEVGRRRCAETGENVRIAASERGPLLHL